MWRQAFALLLIALAGLAMPAPVQAQVRLAQPDPESLVPLPAKLEIEPPGADVPPAIARFHGGWTGTWGDELRHILVVERVSAGGTASIVYATGDLPAYSAYAGWHRTTGAIKDGTLTISLPVATATYVLDGDARLVGTFTNRNGLTTQGLFGRTDPKTLTSPHILVSYQIAGERIFIPHTKVRKPGGGPILLEARLFRPKAVTPAKLAIFNHGSDSGRNKRNSYSHAGQAGWLLGHGFTVLVPMRRGRGLSEGQLGEDTYERAHSGQIIGIGGGIAEAVEDLDAVIAWARAQPFVKPGPVLLAGQSRGGFLSVHYAGLKPAEVLGVINFVGGWMGRNPANERLNAAYFIAAGNGSGSKVPQLWLYADKDSYFTEAFARGNHKAFTEAGGVAQLEFYQGIPGDGHNLRLFPDRWRAAGDAFLKGLAL